VGAYRLTCLHAYLTKWLGACPFSNVKYFASPFWKRTVTFQKCNEISAIKEPSKLKSDIIFPQNPLLMSQMSLCSTWWKL
jgi:hypothetical protein